MGVPNEYVIEFFDPHLDNYEVFHNVAVEGEDQSETNDSDSMIARTASATLPELSATRKVNS